MTQKSKRIVSIDPGNAGGLCALEDKEIQALIPMPLIEITVGRKKRKELDLPAIIDFIKKYADEVAIEKAQAMPPRQIPGKPEQKSQGVVGMFRYGKGYGMLIGICAALGIPYTEIPPRTWKARALQGMPSGKGSSILRAKQLCSKINLLATARCSKPHDGMAEAYLIGRYYLHMYEALSPLVPF